MSKVIYRLLMRSSNKALNNIETNASRGWLIILFHKSSLRIQTVIHHLYQTQWSTKKVTWLGKSYGNHVLSQLKGWKPTHNFPVPKNTDFSSICHHWALFQCHDCTPFDPHFGSTGGWWTEMVPIEMSTPHSDSESLHFILVALFVTIHIVTERWLNYLNRQKRHSSFAW